MPFTELKRDLIERIRQGNSDAFAELYKHYFLHVYGFSLKRLKSKDLAQECTQQTFIKIWERREHLDSNLNLSNYVFMICKNYILRAIQKMLREQKLKERFAFEHLPGSDDGTCTNEMEIAALRVLNLLPPQRKQIFLMCKVEGHEYKKIAMHLGISRGTVRDHIFKATRSIRKSLHLYQR